jgi:DNA-binding beta-propeller fold protein YncE
LTRDGSRIYLTCSDGNAIVVIDTQKKERVGMIRTGNGPGRIALTPDERTLVYNLQPGQAVGFADVASGRETGQVALGGNPLSLTLSRDGRLAYAGIQDQDKVMVVSVEQRKIVRVIETPKGAGPDPAIEIE